MNNGLRGLIGAVSILLMLLAAACSDDENPVAVPDTGSISGTVTLIGAWPTQLNEVQVSIYQGLNPPYIPMGPPEAASDPIPQGTAFYKFTLEGLDKATYTAVYVSARDPQNVSATQLIGMYWAHADSVGVFFTPQGNLPDQQTGPSPITIDDNNIDISNINITANLSLAQ